MQTLIVFLVVPFGYLSLGLLHKGHHYTFLLASLVVMALKTPNQVIRWFMLYISGWIVWLFIKSAFIVQNMHPSVIGPAIKTHAFFLAALIFYNCIVEGKFKLKTAYNIICIGSIIQTMMCVLQMNNIDPVFSGLACIVDTTRRLLPHTMVGTLGNPNFVAAFIAFSVPFFFRRYWGYFLLVILPVLYISRTSSAFGALFIGVLICYGNDKKVIDFILNSPNKTIGLINRIPKINIKSFDINPGLRRYIKYITFGVPLIMAFLYIGVLDTSPINLNFHEGRLAWWLTAIHDTTLNGPLILIFGHGPGAYWSDVRLFPLHNEWITLFHQYGIVGVGFLIFYLITFYKKNKVLTSVLVIALINMMGNYPIELAPTSIFLIIVAGLIEREKKNAKDILVVNNNAYDRNGIRSGPKNKRSNRSRSKTRRRR